VLRFFLGDDELQRSSFMVWVDVEEIQRDLSAYLQRVEAGETLVIVQAGRPVAEVKPIVSGTKALRPFGLCAGEFSVPDNFNAPLPKDILNTFEGQ
jgi:prevent-host-death family protein